MDTFRTWLTKVLKTHLWYISKGVKGENARVEILGFKSAEFVAKESKAPTNFEFLRVF